MTNYTMNRNGSTTILSETISRTELPGGVRVLTEQIPGFRSVSVGIWVEAGARDESAELSGISHFIEHMIFKGTDQRNALEIAKEFDMMGGFSNAFTSRELTCFHVRVLDSNLDTALNLLADIFLNSRFETIELERERSVIMQEISMVEDSPDDYVHELFSRMFWGDSVLGRSILGTPETVASMDSATLQSFVRQSYVAPRVIVSAAGNVVHDSFVESVAPLFKEVKSGELFERASAPAPVMAEKAVHRDIEQTHIIIGYPGPSIQDKSRYAAILLNNLLGGSMSSRLFQEIREKRGLAYSVYSYLNMLHDAGVAGMYAGVAPENRSEVIELMQKELRNLASSPVTADELDGAREHARGAMLLSAESSDARMMKLARDEIHFRRYVSFDEIMNRLDSVTPEAIMEVASGYLDAGFSMVSLGPAET